MLHDRIVVCALLLTFSKVSCENVKYHSLLLLMTRMTLFSWLPFDVRRLLVRRYLPDEIAVILEKVPELGVYVVWCHRWRSMSQ